MKVSRAWLQRFFEKELPSAEVLADALTFHAFEIEGIEKDVLDIKVLPDRAGYALSHRGIAKEVSAILSIPLRSDPLREDLPSWKESEAFSVTADNRYVHRHLGAYVRGVQVAPSPAWLVECLKGVGQRSINNIVDATNFVMLNIGQPTHAFDADSIEMRDGKIEIAIREAASGEQVTVLTGETFSLKENMFVIADGVSGAALDIAGVKGGMHSGVTEATKNLFISVGNYDGELIRKMSQHLSILTDASQRFQNRPSTELAAYGMRDLLALIVEIAGGELEGVIDLYQKRPEKTEVSITNAEIERLLGTTYGERIVADVLTRLDLSYKKDGEVFVVMPPFERTDIRIPEDLIEEVGRIVGYDHIPSNEPLLADPGPLPEPLRTIESIKDVLAQLGFNEISTYTMLSEGDVELAKPLAEDKKYLRTTLSLGHARAVELNAKNLPLFNLSDVRLFEIGRVWPKGKEKAVLGVTFWSATKKLSLKQDEIFSDVERNISSLVGKKVSGQRLLHTHEFDLDTLLSDTHVPGALYEQSHEGMYKPFSVYPFALRDVAVWTPAGTTAEFVQRIIAEASGDLLYRIDLFDTFEKEGRVSYAFRLVLQADDRTLSEIELNDVMERVSKVLSSQVGYEVR